VNADQSIPEEWRPISGFEGLYEVSSLGRIASLPKPTWPGRRILRPGTERGGYLYVTLRASGDQYHRKVHHLVCAAFNGPRPPGAVMRHLDGNPTNNVPSNLVWGSSSENNFDIVRHGRHHNAVKTHCKQGHPLSGPNLYVNPTSGARQCRTCQRAFSLAYSLRKRITCTS
jgi:hypothetical protein